MRRRGMWALVWLGCATFVVTGCGAGVVAPTTQRGTAAPRPPLRTTVYFLSDGGVAPIGVRRTIDHGSHAREALEALLHGPAMDERNRGITTAIPRETRLASLTFKGRGRVVAIVNLAGLPPAHGRQGKDATTGQRVRVITQIARTLIGLSGIAGVEIRLVDKPWDLWTMDGRIVRTVTDYDRLGGWTRICGGRSPDERRRGVSRCFAALP
jgi:hypothetical protein